MSKAAISGHRYTAKELRRSERPDARCRKLSVELSSNSAFDIDQQLFSTIILLRHSSSFSPIFFFLAHAPAQNSLSVPFMLYTARRRLHKPNQDTGPELKRRCLSLLLQTTLTLYATGLQEPVVVSKSRPIIEGERVSDNTLLVKGCPTFTSESTTASTQPKRWMCDVYNLDTRLLGSSGSPATSYC